MPERPLDFGPAEITICPCGYVKQCRFPRCNEGNPETTLWPPGSLDEPRPLPYPKFALPRHSKRRRPAQTLTEDLISHIQPQGGKS